MKADQLPVYQHREKILQALNHHPVIIVESPTGSGKTTQLPVIFHEAGYSDLGVIGVTQPRRIATLGVSDFIAKQLKSSLGDFVGYKMRFEDRTKPSTRIKIMTDGTLLQELKTDPLLSNYSVIMVDEAHERSLNIDFILGLLKQILTKRSDLKIIISSATINVVAFSRYFHHAPIISIETSTYPVTVIYDPPVDDTEETLIVKVVERVESIITTDRKAGDILIFLPGERAIKLCIQALARSAVFKKLWILPLYGMLAKEEQERVFLKTPFGKSKVVLATNIAETSITIDGIRTVIDSGLHKENIYNQRTYTNSLVQDLVSKAAADQRKGRAGRTAAGICYRLYSKEAFTHRPHFGTEEIFRTDLSEVVLRMAGLGVRNFVEFDFIDKPSRAGVASGLETLNLLGALDENHQITPTGQMILQLPLLPRHGRILVEAMMHYPDVLTECAIACAFLSTNNPYLLPLGEELEARQAHQRFQHELGDFMGYQLLFNAFISTEDRENFCKQSYLDLRTMQEIVNVKNQLEEIMHTMGAVVGHGGSTKAYLMSCMAGLIQFICVKTGSNLYRSLTTERIMIHPGSVMFKKSSAYILAGEIVKTSRMYARSVSMVERSWIEELNPELWHSLKVFAKLPRESERSRKDKKGSLTPKVDGVVLGKLQMTVEKQKNKKYHLPLDWQTIRQTAQANPTLEPIIKIKKGVKATLVLDKAPLLSGLNVSFALQLAMNFSPKSMIMKGCDKLMPFEPQGGEELIKFLHHAQDLGKICLSKRGQALGFLTLMRDKSGRFYFKTSPKFAFFLANTQESLEILDDMALMTEGDEASRLLNQLFERLTLFLELH